MKKRKKPVFNRFCAIILVLIAVVLVSRPLFSSGYFSMHDDVQVMRLYQMHRCFMDGQLPCRWVPDMGAGFGHPLYNYHPVFAYYLGIFLYLFQGSYIGVAKNLFLLTYLVSGVGMYLLLKDFFGRKAAVVGTFLFLLAPYHAVEVYVRGALTESWGVAFFPWIFWSIYRFLQNRDFRFSLLAVFSLTGLFLSHNIMTLIFTPLALFWGLYWVWLKDRKAVLYLTGIFGLAFGLSAFFLVPAFLEKSLVKIDYLTSDYYNFRHHFVAVRQLFLDRSWGFGPSRPGPEDEISFQLGWPHWWLAVAAVILFTFRLIKKRATDKSVWFFIFLFGFSVIMTHSKSVIFWNQLDLLSFVQFPWRFLALAMFASSFLGAALVSLISKRRLRSIAAAATILLALVLNLGYFRVGNSFPQMTDEKKLSGEEWEIQSRATLLDYIPKSVEQLPKELAPEQPWIIQGEARISEYRERSNFWRFSVEVPQDQAVLAAVPVFDFPVWQVLIDQQPVEHTADEPSGVILVSLPGGKHTVVGILENTLLRQVANAISLSSLFLLLLIIIIQDVRYKKA